MPKQIHHNDDPRLERRRNLLEARRQPRPKALQENLFSFSPYSPTEFGSESQMPIEIVRRLVAHIRRESGKARIRTLGLLETALVTLPFKFNRRYPHEAR